MRLGHLGYAITAHRAQSATVDTAHVITGPGMTREHLYVAMTRARERLHITCAGEPSPLLDRALWSTST